MEIVEENPITMVELNSEITKIRKRDEEVNFRVGKVEEYLHHFVKLKPAQAKEIKSELEKLNVPRLRDIHINKLIDILPTSADEVKVVLEGYTITITKTNCDAIAKTIKKFLG